MLSDFTKSEHVCLACGYSDLLQGIDGWLPSHSKASALTRFSTACLCSAEEDATA